ncbi:uncharacterized protein BKA55DRAFT_680147 [Fusarium redolens]|jgi:hypothetical protein|uniref:ER-bound oxygenase mpaB/mpaB'/Rubber oxygenase catalytic domain-containing protein n=1 Tax=Fusarium redolens TaxID=48865 RepID=A0A9P9G3A7_FUSRE|nr:uncharacterized protein BKA55DRAFT_680147 [Fusarium redolens]KAH7231708.1 hypothetical protein BKA55DRAFT_680147 [Fusarium redolens]
MYREPTPGGYHWISSAIESLDPETDYELMWRLMSCYRSSDFMNNMIYALTFPNFVITTHGAETVWRSDGGKVIKRGAQRVEDTENYNMTWWHYGPSDERCREAVRYINNLHASLARRYPGNFSDNDDFLYVMTFSTVLMHRLRLRLGLSGFTEKEKTVAHHFWRDMTPLFIKEDGSPVHGYPDDFEDCLDFCEVYENTPREFDERMQHIGLAIMNQFAFRYFPPGLRWLGVSIPKALSLPTTINTMRIKPVNPVLKWIIVFVVGTLMSLAETFLPDPRESFWKKIETLDEKDAKLRKADIRASDQAYSEYIQAKWSGPGCPFFEKDR